MGKDSLRTLIAAAGFSAAGIMLAGCGPSLGPSKAVSELTPEEAQGRAVYSQDCASCHYANQTGDLHGPSLFAMYRKKYLPSGAPANDARVAPVILGGRNMMPGSQLSDEQLRDLLAYLHTL